jgi:hypothetical protein
MVTARMQTLDFPIADAGPLSRATRSRGYRNFVEVAEAVRALPYGRVRDSQDALAVLEEHKGTCSSKHRFLAALAHECGHTEVMLMLGLYEMSEANTPGVGSVLRAEGLTAIPEAHCYLMSDGQRYDFTGLPSGAASPFHSLVEERAVSPIDLASAKAEYHRSALSGWAHARGVDPDRAWAVREKCIELLADSTPHADARELPASASTVGARAGGRGR